MVTNFPTPFNKKGYVIAIKPYGARSITNVPSNFNTTYFTHTPMIIMTAHTLKVILGPNFSKAYMEGKLKTT